MSNAADLAEELIERTPVRVQPKLGTHTCVVYALGMNEPIVFEAYGAEGRTGHLVLEGIDVLRDQWAGGYIGHAGQIQWLGNSPGLRDQIRPQLEALRQHR